MENFLCYRYYVILYIQMFFLYNVIYVYICYNVFYEFFLKMIIKFNDYILMICKDLMFCQLEIFQSILFDIVVSIFYKLFLCKGFKYGIYVNIKVYKNLKQ